MFCEMLIAKQFYEVWSDEIHYPIRNVFFYLPLSLIPLKHWKHTEFNIWSAYISIYLTISWCVGKICWPPSFKIVLRSLPLRVTQNNLSFWKSSKIYFLKQKLWEEIQLLSKSKMQMTSELSIQGYFMEKNLSRRVYGPKGCENI